MPTMSMTRIREGVPVGRRYRLPLGLLLLIWLLMIVPVVGVVALGFPPLLAPLLWIGASLGVASFARAQIAIAHIRIEQAELIGRTKAAMRTGHDHIVVLDDPEMARRDTAWDDAEADLVELREQLVKRGGNAVAFHQDIPESLAERVEVARDLVDHFRRHPTASRGYHESVIAPARQALDEVYLAIGEHLFGATLAACQALPALKRPFTLTTDCQRGHVGEHRVVESDSHDRVTRACCVDGCDSTWTEWA